MSSVEQLPPVQTRGYRLQEVLGKGGEAVVYRALHQDLDRIVAIKLPQVADPAFLRRARELARLAHPGIVTVHDCVADGQPMLVMEYMAGGSLSQQLRGCPLGLPQQRVLAIAGQLCAALAHAHGLGIAHGDLKPGNVLFSVEGDAKLADFGCAPAAEQVELSITVVQPARVRGSLLYMAPEQLNGERPGASVGADLYALGKLLYTMLTGRVPATVRPFRTDHPSLHPAWEPLVFALLEERAERRPSLIAVQDTLRAIRHRAGRPPLACEAHSPSRIGEHRRAPLAVRPPPLPPRPSEEPAEGRILETGFQPRRRIPPRRRRVSSVVWGLVAVLTIPLALIGLWGLGGSALVVVAAGLVGMVLLTRT